MSTSRRFRWDFAAIVLGDSPGGNYTEHAMNIGAQRARTGHFGLVHVDVMHDDWCALLTKGLPCNCNPEVRERDA